MEVRLELSVAERSWRLLMGWASLQQWMERGQYRHKRKKQWCQWGIQRTTVKENRTQGPKFICSLIYYCLLLSLLGFNYACSEQLFVVWAEYACIPFWLLPPQSEVEASEILPSWHLLLLFQDKQYHRNSKFKKCGMLRVKISEGFYNYGDLISPLMLSSALRLDR